MKKTEGKSKSKAKKSAKKKQSAQETKKVDMDEVRENISNLVGESAGLIAQEVIETAKKGALASAKYLFEVVGLYPATEATVAKPEEESLAGMLLDRLGGPPRADEFRDAEEEVEDEAKIEKADAGVESEGVDAAE